MRNGKGQLGRYVRAALGGAVYGLAGGAVYAAIWGLTHWTVTGKGLTATAPWLLAVGAALGLLAGLGWAFGAPGQAQGAAEAGRARVTPVPAVLNRLGSTATLRRLRG